MFHYNSASTEMTTSEPNFSSTPLDLFTFIDDRTSEPSTNFTFAHDMIFGTTTNPGPDEIEILPNQIAQMTATKITIIPSAVILLISCSFLCLTIFTYFRRVIKLYIGLVFYSLTEVILFIKILLIYLLSANGVLRKVPCGVTKAMSFFTMALPSLAVLLITVSRLIFIKYPLRYRNILIVKYQVLSCVAAVIFAFLLALWPAIGACEPFYDRRYGLCHLNCDSLCYKYIAVYITLGILLPTIVVIGIYIYVYSVLKKHRARVKKRNDTLRGQNDTYSGSGRKYRSSGVSGSCPTIPEIVVTDQDQTQTGITIVNRLSLTIDKGSNSLSNISFHTETNVIFTNNEKKFANEGMMNENDSGSERKTDPKVEVVGHVSVTKPKEMSTFAGLGDIYKNTNTIYSGNGLHGGLEERKSAADEKFYANPIHSHIGRQDILTKEILLPLPSSVNLLSPDWHKRLEIGKENVKLSDILNLKPFFWKTMKRLSLVTEHTDQLRKKEIPWSLVLLTLIHITSSIPWIAILILQDSIDMFTDESGRDWLDFGNALLVGSVGVCPLLYILFTRLIRDKVWQIIKRIFKMTLRDTN